MADPVSAMLPTTSTHRRPCMVVIKVLLANSLVLQNRLYSQCYVVGWLAGWWVFCLLVGCTGGGWLVGCWLVASVWVWVWFGLVWFGLVWFGLVWWLQCRISDSCQARGAGRRSRRIYRHRSRNCWPTRS